MIPKSPSVSIVVFSMDYETSKLTQVLRITHNDSKETFGEYCLVFYGLCDQSTTVHGVQNMINCSLVEHSLVVARRPNLWWKHACVLDCLISFQSQRKHIVVVQPPLRVANINLIVAPPWEKIINMSCETR